MNGKISIDELKPSQISFQRNNINISRLTDNNSALSKQSLGSFGSANQIEKLLGSNSQQLYLRPNALLDMKNGMLASAEMT